MGGGLVLAVLCVAMVSQYIKSVQRDKQRASDRAIVQLHRDLADRAEASGDLDYALQETRAALAEARQRGLGEPADLLRIQGERARRRARRILESVPDANPVEGVRLAGSLAAEARTDPDLKPLLPQIEQTVRQAANRRLERLEAEIAAIRARVRPRSCSTGPLSSRN